LFPQVFRSRVIVQFRGWLAVLLHQQFRVAGNIGQFDFELLSGCRSADLIILHRPFGHRSVDTLAGAKRHDVLTVKDTENLIARILATGLGGAVHLDFIIVARRQVRGDLPGTGTTPRGPGGSRCGDGPDGFSRLQEADLDRRPGIASIVPLDRMLGSGLPILPAVGRSHGEGTGIKNGDGSREFVVGLIRFRNGTLRVGHDFQGMGSRAEGAKRLIIEIPVVIWVQPVGPQP